MSRAPVELFADCTHCGLESGVLETYDPDAAAGRFGLPARAQCRLCGREQRSAVHGADGSEVVARDLDLVPANACPACRTPLEPSALDDKRCAKCGATARAFEIVAAAPIANETEIAARLDAWAAREGTASRDELLTSYFVEPSIAAIARAIAEKKPIATVTDPFALGGARVVSRTESPELPVAPPVELPKEAPPPPSAPPRAIVYPLVSVIAADGELHASEREVVDRFLASEGLSPLRPEEFRVHRAEEVARFVPPEKRETVIELMCEAACADGIPDASEVRVIRAYAAAWKIPEDKLEIWLWGYEHASASGARQLWLKIRRFLLSSRWENDA